MSAIYARCGNRCDLCPLYAGNLQAIGCRRVNEGLLKYHQQGMGTPPSYSRPCDGCLSAGYVAREDCPIRNCANSRGLATCASCGELFCHLLVHDMAIIEGAVERYRGSISQEDYDRFLRPFLIRDALSRLRTGQSVGDEPDDVE